MLSSLLTGRRPRPPAPPFPRPEHQSSIEEVRLAWDFLELLGEPSGWAIVCIGTPHVEYDSLGPRLGSMLYQHRSEHPLYVLGTVSEPVDGRNLDRIANRVRDWQRVLAIDAAVGPHPGRIVLRRGPLPAGAGTGRTPTLVGTHALMVTTARTWVRGTLHGPDVDVDRYVLKLYTALRMWVRLWSETWEED